MSEKRSIYNKSVRKFNILSEYLKLCHDRVLPWYLRSLSESYDTLSLSVQTSVNLSISTIVDLSTLTPDDQEALLTVASIFTNLTDILAQVSQLNVDYYIDTDNAQNLEQWTRDIKVSRIFVCYMQTWLNNIIFEIPVHVQSLKTSNVELG